MAGIIGSYDYVLETNNLSKFYKDVGACKNVNIHIKDGDIYGFVGENGAGKTTLIRLINGLSIPTSGTFSLFGIPNSDPKIVEAKKLVGAIVETVSMNKGFSCLQNMQYQNIITESYKKDEELIAIIEKCGLKYNDIRGRKVANFSLGMRQRLGIAMALVSDPKLIILDEPMNGLDPEGIIEMRDTIINLNKEGVTFLISSHILAELDKVCNKIGIISHGEIVEEISIDELHAKSRKQIFIETEQGEAAAKILVEKLDLKEIKVFKNDLSIYDDVEISAVMKVLLENNIAVNNFQTRQESIEDYYIKRIKGGN